MRVQKSPTLSPVFLSVFIVAICMIGLSAANVQAATFTVMNTNDSGAGSLRQAIADANAAAGADTIDFDTGVFATSQSITLTTGELVINSEMTIQGPGANLLISGANASRIFFNDHGTMTLKGLTLTAGNGSGSQFDKFGGALYNNGGTVTIDGCRVAGNSGPDGGGGVYSRIGILTVRNSNVSGNFGGFDGDGGGIGGISGLTLVENSTFNGNSAFKGGGLKVSGSVTITNSTFSDNSAFYGGGISGESATLNIAASTLSGNRAGFAGGGVYGPSGASSIQNSIVAGNKKTPDSPNDIEGGMFGIADNNLIGDASTSGGAVNGVNGNIVGTNAMLGPLQFNGGATMTHALLPGSPAINAGGPTNLATDQRGIGFGRVVGAAADIGAFEVQPACVGVSFSLPTNYAAGGSQNSVTTGDFNNDGKLDLRGCN